MTRTVEGVRKSVKRGKYRLVNGVGLSELDELVVDAYDPEFAAEH